MITKINDTISYISTEDTVLSSDIAVIRGSSRLWLFDVGNGDEMLKEITSLAASGIHGYDLPKSAVISHFHPDHLGNFDKVEAKYYVGKNTFKYSHGGSIVESDLHIDDGVRLHIFPIPSSHAKGSLGLEVDGTYAFIGDAIASTEKAGRRVFNAGVLLDEIRTIKKLEARYILRSHLMYKIYEKDEIIAKLEEVYAMRKDGEPYIVYEQGTIPV